MNKNIERALEILDERLAKGELSDIDYQNKIRLMNLVKEHLKENRFDESEKVTVKNNSV